MNKYVRSDLQDFVPYYATAKPYQVKVDANEFAYAHQDALAKHMYAWMLEKDNITRYPDTDANALRDTIANFYSEAHINRDQIICGVGSDQLIEYIIKIFIEPGQSILVPTPSFSMYELSGHLNHAKVLTYALKEDTNHFFYDIDALKIRIQEEKPKLVFICNPNNPTGNTIGLDSIKEILQIADCPVILDEAYIEFGGESGINLVNQYDNLIVLRTFSKAYGLAGLRIGYGIADKGLIDAIQIAKAPYNISSYAQEAAKFALTNADYYKEKIKIAIQERVHLEKALKDSGVASHIFDSVTNFILIRFKEPFKNLAEELSREEILIRAYGNKGPLAGCARITVGTPDENKKIIQKIKEVTHAKSSL